MNKKINKKVIVNLEELLKNDAPYLVEDGKVNLKKLQSLLKGKTTEKEDDRFYFNWAGKNKVFQAIQAPTYLTLAPQKDKSIGWNNTENLMIVGENLETLKLLLKPYFGQVKVIYIDPPYNTGKDFIYKDDFSSPLKEYLEKTGQKDGNGNKLSTLAETSGRYHSDWLNFMYPRLFLARNLLKDDGVIFISIDDHEVHHLRMIMDEIFGEDNFVEQITIISNPRGSQASKQLANVHEYLLVYAKDVDQFSLRGYVDEDKITNKYPYEDERGRYRLLGLRQRGGAWRREDRPNMYFPLYVNPDNGSVSVKKDEEHFVESLPIRPSGEEGRWTWSKAKCKNESELLIGKKVDREGESNFYDIFRKDYARDEAGQLKGSKPKSVWNDKGLNYQNGRQEVKELFEGKNLFDFPKPTMLIKKQIEMFGVNKEDEFIVLDFFAGSGTTGQAVWELNKEDGGNRKFILVQLDESVDDTKETGKNAKKLGLNTIADICIERLRRASEKMKNEDKNKLIKENGKLDLGFKVFKLSPSNFNLKEEFELDDNKDLNELKDDYLKQLGLYVDQPVLPTANTIDIVYEIILKNGFSLNSKIKEIKIGSNKFYFVSDKENNLEMYICLDSKIENTSVEEIRTTEYKGKTFAFYDNSLTDSQKINLNTFVKLQVI